MAALPYMQLYVADYLADTAHLNAAQHGAYLLLLMNYWQRGKPLKDDNERLANVARMSSDEWNKNREVLAEFFEVSDEEWLHHRVERDLEKVHGKSAKASAAGKASAERRMNKRSTNVEQTFNHTDTDTDTDTKHVSPNGDMFPAVADNVVKPPKKGGLDCPHQKLIELYHLSMPNNPEVRAWSEARKRMMATRWKEMAKEDGYKNEEEGLDYWRRYFEFANHSEFLTGRSATRDGIKPFLADMEWLIKPANFIKVIEGKYHNAA